MTAMSRDTLRGVNFRYSGWNGICFQSNHLYIISSWTRSEYNLIHYYLQKHIRCTHKCKKVMGAYLLMLSTHPTLSEVGFYDFTLSIRFKYHTQKMDFCRLMDATACTEMNIWCTFFNWGNNCLQDFRRKLNKSLNSQLARTTGSVITWHSRPHWVN